MATDSLLVGAEGAEDSTVVRSPSAGHRIFVLGSVSVDALLAHQSRVFLFNLAVQDGRVQRPLPRNVVGSLIRRY